ncbi:hypothetical protein CVT26_001950 [Gymnopilus dilepis]|uniref:F-box domain-containing protein n=1 Tax=Gymnopilus dilepis TaxID=231916 RepID=A0A409WE21_9AGAR|nr:hypothetical protein CVT26_001950 [Gymnopilus dilepis]
MNTAHDPFILKLPLEIASIIFEYWCPTPELDPACFSHGIRKKVAAPLILGAVCRGWRIIAWSLPKLWTYVEVRLDRPAKLEFEIASEWLQRSKQLLISVQVTTFALGSIAHRIIQDFSTLKLDTHTSVTWTQVGSLEIGQCLDLLRAAPDLIYCKFYEVQTHDNVGQYSSVTNFLCHSKLQKLVFHGQCAHVAIEVFEKVSLPALEELEVDVNFDDLPTDALKKFFNRSARGLWKLTIFQAQINVTGFVSMLQKVPSLELLVLCPEVDTGFDLTEFLNVLGETAIRKGKVPKESSLLPNLREFRYWAWAPQDVDWQRVPQIFGPLLGLDNPRRRPLDGASFDLIGPLQELSEDDLNCLRPVRDAGIDLRITTKGSGWDYDLLEGAKREIRKEEEE